MVRIGNIKYEVGVLDFGYYPGRKALYHFGDDYMELTLVSLTYLYGKLYAFYLKNKDNHHFSISIYNDKLIWS